MFVLVFQRGWVAADNSAFSLLLFNLDIFQVFLCVCSHSPGSDCSALPVPGIGAPAAVSPGADPPEEPPSGGTESSHAVVPLQRSETTLNCTAKGIPGVFVHELPIRRAGCSFFSARDWGRVVEPRGIEIL